MVFKINGIDFTTSIVVGTYAVNKEDDYSEYIDANHKKHRYSVREKISGKFNMYFRNETNKKAFIDALANPDMTGRYYVTASVNNQGVDKSFYAYIDANPTRNTVGARDTFEQFTVNIEEQ